LSRAAATARAFASRAAFSFAVLGEDVLDVFVLEEDALDEVKTSLRRERKRAWFGEREKKRKTARRVTLNVSEGRDKAAAVCLKSSRAETVLSTSLLTSFSKEASCRVRFDRGAWAGAVAFSRPRGTGVVLWGKAAV